MSLKSSVKPGVYSMHTGYSPGQSPISPPCLKPLTTISSSFGGLRVRCAVNKPKSDLLLEAERGADSNAKGI